MTDDGSRSSVQPLSERQKSEESGRTGFYRGICSHGFVRLILELLELLILTRNACGPVSIRAAIAG